MSETIALRNTKMSVVEEVTKNTPVAETAAGAFTFRADGLTFNLDRNMVESNEVTGSLTKTASQPGMYSEDLGFSVSFNIRGKGTKSVPPWAMFLKSVMGQQNANTDNAVAAAPAPTTTAFTANAANDFDEGQLVTVNDEIVRLEDITLEALTCWPPLATTPIAADDILAGISWMLLSDNYPSFTSYIYFQDTLRLRYAGCQAVSCEMNFEVGQPGTITFQIKALSVTYDRTVSVVTPVYDDTTEPPMCLSIGSKTLFSAVAKGVPTQTETILTAPNFQVLAGDLIMIDVGSSVYETVAISVVSGTEAADQTLTHASVSVAASADDVVYILHEACAYLKDTLTLKIEMGDVAEKCMTASSGFSGRKFTSRAVTISRSPFFRNWQEFLLRDNVISSLLQIVLGNVTNNIFCAHVARQVTGEASLNTDDLMSVDVSSQAVKDSVLGNDHEIVIAAF